MKKLIDEKNLPLVSVVITCYNYGRFLSEAIESVLNQTYNNLQIIIVDDGSTDNTLEVVKKYLRKKNILYIKQENKGQACAKNIGIKNSNGKFIAFLDADDKWKSLKLERQMVKFNNKDIKIVYSGVQYIDENGKYLPISLKGKYFKPHRGNVTRYLIFDNFIPFSSVVVDKICFEQQGFFNEELKMGIDWDLWLRFSLYYKFDYIKEKMLIYRIGHKNQMSRNTELRLNNTEKIFNEFIENNRKKISKRIIKKAKAYNYLNRAYYYGLYESDKALIFLYRAFKENKLDLNIYKTMLYFCFNRLFKRM